MPTNPDEKPTPTDSTFWVLKPIEIPPQESGRVTVITMTDHVDPARYPGLRQVQRPARMGRLPRYPEDRIKRHP